MPLSTNTNFKVTDNEYLYNHIVVNGRVMSTPMYEDQPDIVKWRDATALEIEQSARISNLELQVAQALETIDRLEELFLTESHVLASIKERLTK